MKILVTGGAGFIGRWVVKKLLELNHNITVIDNLSNGSMDNIKEFIEDKYSSKFNFVNGDIKDINVLNIVFRQEYDIIYHLAASINVQDSIDDPKTTFLNDTVGTFNILEFAKTQMFGKNFRMKGDKVIVDNSEEIHPCKIVFMSTCMVYDIANNVGIDELHNTKPNSPYSASKLAAENLVLSYYNTYGLPSVVIRPFNTYGPFQKSNGEGGVVPIFINKALNRNDIDIYGDGNQTRDLLYVEDCAEFVIKAGINNTADGEIINAGTGNDVTINELAKIISRGRSKINHIAHIHPQSEIMKLKCNYDKARRLLNWEPKYTLDQGIKEIEKWLKKSSF